MFDREKGRAFYLPAVLMLLLVHALSVRAESPTTVVVAPIPYYYGPFIDTERLPIFDDRVFNLRPKSGPETSPGGHFYGEEPDYTYDQRRRWIKECEPLKKRHFEKFRSCYEEAKERDLYKAIPK